MNGKCCERDTDGDGYCDRHPRDSLDMPIAGIGRWLESNPFIEKITTSAPAAGVAMVEYSFDPTRMERLVVVHTRPRRRIDPDIIRDAVARGREFRSIVPKGFAMPTREQRTRICAGCGIAFLLCCEDVLEELEEPVCWDCL